MQIDTPKEPSNQTEFLMQKYNQLTQQKAWDTIPPLQDVRWELFTQWNPV